MGVNVLKYFEMKTVLNLPVCVSNGIDSCRYSTEEDAASLPERECPICRDDFAVGNKVIKMPCSHSHVFHKSCVAEWLERDDSCPMCRSALPVWLGRPQYA